MKLTIFSKSNVQEVHNDLLIIYWTSVFIAGPCLIFYHHYFVEDLRITVFQCIFNIIYCVVPLYVHFNFIRIDEIIKLFTKFDPFALLVALALCIIGTFFYPEVFAKRIIFFVLFCPVILILFKKLYKLFKSSKSFEIKLIIIFCKISLIMLWLPGGYAPPFFTGIAGWTIKYNDKDFQREFRYVHGIKLIRYDGNSVWMPFGVLSPINFVNRHWIGFKKKYPENMSDLYGFYFRTYCYNFKLLEKGYFSNQRYLGRFAYPGHTPYEMQNFKGFDPINIEYIGWIEDKVRISDKKVLSTYTIEKFFISKEFRNIHCVK